MSNRVKLLARKVGIAFGIGAGLAIITKAGPVIDAIGGQDWPTFVDAGRVLVFGSIAGGMRALVALLTAWVPTDADVGLNLLGKFRND